MNLFTAQIGNWREWGRLFQSIPAFAPLVKHIMRAENLPDAEIENLTPGTNAVFKVGSYVIKIFAPPESGYDQTPDLMTELYATRRANRIGVAAPRLIADGFVDDKYRFAYMITDHIKGPEFMERVKTMTDVEKTEAGRTLRAIADTMNTPCEPFNDVDVIGGEGRFKVWEKFPDRFKAERLEYKRAHDFGELVFVHGDLCGDNIIMPPDGGMFLIDFADAALAPASYEHMLVALELFNFEGPLMRGFFGDADAESLADAFMEGVLIHINGGGLIRHNLGDAQDFDSIGSLRRALVKAIERSQ